MWTDKMGRMGLSVQTMEEDMLGGRGNEEEEEEEMKPKEEEEKGRKEEGEDWNDKEWEEDESLGEILELPCLNPWLCFPWVYRVSI